MGVDNATYKDCADRGWFVTRDGEEIIDARRLAGQIGVAKASRKHNLRRVSTFHNRVAKAKEFAESLPDVIDPANARPKGNVWSQYVSGQIPMSTRRQRLDRLRDLDASPRALISNARCLSGASMFRPCSGSHSSTPSGATLTSPSRGPCYPVCARQEDRHHRRYGRAQCVPLAPDVIDRQRRLLRPFYLIPLTGREIVASMF